MTNSSHLLYKTRCPKCAENGKDRHGDNLGVYSDGHSYCFNCGFWTSASTEAKLQKKTKEVKAIPDLPEDITTELDDEPRQWLLQYFDTDKLPRCLWSVSQRKLYFMLEGGAYQYRYFGDNKDHPKWVGYGINDNLIHIIGNSRSSTSLVLVEDLISGIKVGQVIPTLTLFGSNISLKRLATIKLLGYNETIIWLDWDKKEYAIKAAQLAQSIGLKARVIHTKLDPKEYSIEQIKEILDV
jgi:hypothetical protein